MKKLLSLLIAALLITPLAAQTSETAASSGLRISLLTCTQGKDVSSAFGHSAVRVIDSLHRRDLVFNYGTFSFNEPNFMLKFLHGDLNYFLSISNFRSFVYAYQSYGRGVSEQVLYLTEKQKAEIYSFLLKNYEPQNRYYLYDFLVDNCATRIRDIFHTPDFSIDDLEIGASYRDELRRLVGDRRWMMFGIDLILGMKTDKDITRTEAMFLPDRLSEYIQAYANAEMDHEPLAGKPIEVFPPAEGQGKFMDILSKVLSPVSVFSILILVYILIYLRGRINRWKFADITATVLYIIIGIGGLIICYMWFGTNHVWTKLNWNILWMNPLYLIPVFMRPGKPKNIVITVLTAVSVVALFSWAIPQDLNIASILLIAFQVLVAASRRLAYVKH